MVENGKRRVDGNGRAFAGSQRQIQTYVNQFPENLNQVIAQTIGADLPADSRIRWVSPLAEQRYAEYRDGDFLLALGMSHYTDDLRRFWPRGGPCWDALARIENGNGNLHGCILVEAKSHVPEFYSSDTRAGASSKPQIEKALRMAKEWFGSPASAVWTGFSNPNSCLYQYANRLAHLYLFRSIIGVPAFLVNVQFLYDPHSPTDLGDWMAAISSIHEELGLRSLPNCVVDVFLPAHQ